MTDSVLVRAGFSGFNLGPWPPPRHYWLVLDLWWYHRGAMSRMGGTMHRPPRDVVWASGQLSKPGPSSEPAAGYQLGRTTASEAWSCLVGFVRSPLTRPPVPPDSSKMMKK